ncbi:MAG: prepilin-type N-terminal cleavage/methylation domain-containing protein [Oscillospiraceae bacterium]|nr:prepilin-type N-terminal cleavage/methylation domain-containing protein [Oscillospiraceae bacterium]
MRKVKGFTLIECIVALAVLGIASLTMAQIYANVSLRNRNNHLVNASLSDQMEYVEKYTDTEAVPIYFGSLATNKSTPDADAKSADRKPPHKTNEASNNNYIVIKRCEPDPAGGGKVKHAANQTYSFPVDIYVLYSRDQDGDAPKICTENPTTKEKTWADNPNYDGEAESNYNLRYKYIVGHKN